MASQDFNILSALKNSNFPSPNLDSNAHISDSNNSDANKSTPKNNTVCNFGAEKCVGTTYFSCGNNSWINNGDTNSKCGYFIECDKNQTKCSGTNYISCKNNKWVDHGRINGKCGVAVPSRSGGVSSGGDGSSVGGNNAQICTQGMESCSQTNRLVCENNSWVNKGDVNGFCGFYPQCAAGQTSCDSNNYLTCDNNYDWTNNGDTNGYCSFNPLCSAGQVSCNGTNHLSCDDNYTWTNNDDTNGFCGVIIFTKSNFGDENDCITSNVCITRGDTKGPFNSVAESSYSFVSPKDTEWFFGSYCNNDLNFQTWVIAANSNPNSTIGVPACIHLISDNLYFNIKILQWGGGNTGGGFGYIRTPYLPNN